MYKHPQGHFQWALWGKNQFLVITTYSTAVTIDIAFFDLKMHPTYCEMLSKDRHGLCILSGILQPKSIPHSVQHANSHDITGSGKGKKETGKKRGRRMKQVIPPPLAMLLLQLQDPPNPAAFHPQPTFLSPYSPQKNEDPVFMNHPLGQAYHSSCRRNSISVGY